MRLFVSVDIDELADDIRPVQELLAEAEGIRTTDPTQTHVTLKFLGDTDEERLDEVDAELQRAVADSGVESFEAECGGLGVFPDMKYISVVWVGFRVGGEELGALHESIEDRMTAMAFDPEDHDFTPHATIARMDHAGGKRHVQDVVRNRDPTVGTVTVDEVRLTESTLPSDGPVYSTVERYPLS